jgi:hypothetical protein
VKETVYFLSEMLEDTVEGIFKQSMHDARGGRVKDTRGTANM